ncbi:MAG: DsbA family protein [Gemmatimonadaceae bacterium]
MTDRQGILRTPVSEQDHSSGPPDAPVTLVEYGDFQCPYCFQAHPIVMALQDQLGDALRFVFRNFPISELHPYAQKAAEAAESVAARAGADAYWVMHHAIYEHQKDAPDALDQQHLVQYATTAGADAVQTTRDLEQGAFAEKVREDFLSGVHSGVNGTPTFFINGERYDGDWTNLAEFEDALRRAGTATAGRSRA